MRDANVSFRGALRTGLGAFRAAFVPIVGFEVIYKTLTTLAVRPLMAFFGQLLLRLAGDELAFNESIWHFALTVPGILAVLLLGGIAVIFVYFEFAVVISLAKQPLREEAVGIKAALVRGLWALGSLKSPTVLLFALYALFLLPVTNMGVTSSLLPQLVIPNFITGELEKNPGGQWLLLGLMALAGMLVLVLLFVLPAMVLERFHFGTAVKRSLRALGAYRLRLLGMVLVFVLAWLVLFLVPRQIFDFFFGATSVSLGEAIAYYGFSLSTPVMLLVWLVASLLQVMLMPLLLTLLTACYLPLAELREPEVDARDKIERGLDRVTGWLQSLWRFIVRMLQTGYHKLMERPFVQKHRKLLAVLLVLALLGAIVRAVMTVPGVHDPIVIGHRGSAYGVENTLEAIQHAIDAGADYAEVDVLLSADGVPMVIHDANLQRLAGRNLNVYDLTAEQLQQLPLSQNGYEGCISTLEEVVEYCEGKILLAVEYKLHGREQEDLIEQVMQVMTQSDYQKHSIYLSLDFALVSQMKTQYPKYGTGYCVYGNVGQLTTGSLLDMNIDFLLVEEWMATKALVKACRRAWVPVYVWTANDSERMDDYLRMGVVGLVTDYPDMAMEVLGTMYDLTDMQKPYYQEE